MHGLFDHLVVIEFEFWQTADIEPGTFSTVEIGMENGLGKIGDRIKTYRDRLIQEPALFSVTQAGELEPAFLVESTDLGPIWIAEGLELLQEEVVDAGPFPDNPRGRLDKGLGPENIPPWQTPAIHQLMLDQ